jgi:aspartyl-tRNA(Asn)/glutamyl-tRNA(Gln) amidotransferase subunit B
VWPAVETRWHADSQSYLDRLRQDLPDLPWETVKRISETYGVIQRDVETLLGLDEYEATGIRYFEEVTQGDTKLGKRTSNLSAVFRPVSFHC